MLFHDFLNDLITGLLGYFTDLLNGIISSALNGLFGISA